MDLVYVTGNKGKIIRAKEEFNEHGINIEWYDHDCDEPLINDIEYISKYKVLEAYNIIQKPCFVVDSGFYIDNYPGEAGFPGAFPKRAIINADGGILGLLEVMKDIQDRKCRFVDCLTYYDGSDFKTFYGISEGILSYEKRGIDEERAKSDLWYIFQPNNHKKTLAEMSDEERNSRKDNRTSAIKEFIKWYQPELNHNENACLKKKYN